MQGTHAGLARRQAPVGSRARPGSSTALRLLAGALLAGTTLLLLVLFGQGVAGADPSSAARAPERDLVQPGGPPDDQRHIPVPLGPGYAWAPRRVTVADQGDGGQPAPPGPAPDAGRLPAGSTTVARIVAPIPRPKPSQPTQPPEGTGGPERGGVLERLEGRAQALQAQLETIRKGFSDLGIRARFGQASPDAILAERSALQQQLRGLAPELATLRERLRYPPELAARTVQELRERAELVARAREANAQRTRESGEPSSPESARALYEIHKEARALRIEHNDLAEALWEKLQDKRQARAELAVAAQTPEEGQQLAELDREAAELQGGFDTARRAVAYSPHLDLVPVEVLRARAGVLQSDLDWWTARKAELGVPDTYEAQHTLILLERGEREILRRQAELNRRLEEPVEPLEGLGGTPAPSPDTPPPPPAPKQDGQLQPPEPPESPEPPASQYAGIDADPADLAGPTDGGGLGGDDSWLAADNPFENGFPSS
jgi:hypothetical protein